MYKLNSNSVNLPVQFHYDIPSRMSAFGIQSMTNQIRKIFKPEISVTKITLKSVLCEKKSVTPVRQNMLPALQLLTFPTLFIGAELAWVELKWEKQ